MTQQPNTLTAEEIANKLELDLKYLSGRTPNPNELFIPLLEIKEIIDDSNTDENDKLIKIRELIE